MKLKRGTFCYYLVPDEADDRPEREERSDLSEASDPSDLLDLAELSAVRSERSERVSSSDKLTDSSSSSIEDLCRCNVPRGIVLMSNLIQQKH